MDVIASLISLVALIVFFVMAARIGTLVDIGRKQIKQNDEILKAIRGGELSEEEKAKRVDEFAKYKNT